MYIKSLLCRPQAFADLCIHKPMASAGSLLLPYQMHAWHALLINFYGVELSLAANLRGRALSGRYSNLKKLVLLGKKW